ncbi:ABC transporter permease [Bacilliculturomica massiliensis]|uniref:ABC transporter permease n=1 Tax=Bacilliculturomica massiliensis TaxID=1917867 RepID=UPI0010318BF8|nr:ABC transporter permease [Bacilliculturomica massiliensis]
MKFLKRLLSNKLAVLGIFFILIFLLASLFAPLIATQDYSEMDLYNVLALPSAEHLMGTDEMGRDIFSGIIYGARTSVLIGVSVLLFGGLVGTAIGILAGFFEGKLDMVLMRIIDTLMAFPSILLAMFMIAIIGTGLKGAIVAVSIATVPRFARIVRSSVLKTKKNEYVDACRVLGQSNMKILFRHILPNGMAPIIVQATLTFSEAILIISGLGFLGLGADPMSAEWGAMLSNARAYLMTKPHIAIFPGIAIAITVLGFNLLGDGLRDTLDVKEY